MYARNNNGWIVKISGRGVGTEITDTKKLRTYVKRKVKEGWVFESFEGHLTADGINYYTLSIKKA